MTFALQLARRADLGIAWKIQAVQIVQELPAGLIPTQEVLASPEVVKILISQVALQPVPMVNKFPDTAFPSANLITVTIMTAPAIQTRELATDKPKQH